MGKIEEEEANNWMGFSIFLGLHLAMENVLSRKRQHFLPNVLYLVGLPVWGIRCRLSYYLEFFFDDSVLQLSKNPLT